MCMIRVPFHSLLVYAESPLFPFKARNNTNPLVAGVSGLGLSRTRGRSSTTTTTLGGVKVEQSDPAILASFHGF